MRASAVLLAVLALCATVGIGGPSAAAAPVLDGSAPPPGANDWRCRPSTAHPDPVVLVHGTWGNQDNWNKLAPALKAQGYCVYALNYGRDTASLLGRMPGIYGTGDIGKSAVELANFIGKVRAATSSEHVDLVAHSQGGVVARQYLRFGGGADAADPQRNVVRKLVTLGATNHGSTSVLLGYPLDTASAAGPVAGAVTGVLGVSAVQQISGSKFLTHLNAGGDTVPGVDYTVIATRMDDTTTPPESTFLRAGPRAVVDNIWLQTVCAGADVTHVGLPRSPIAIQLVLRALDPSYKGRVCRR
ncbi:esterase/lipase family protein [Nocardia jiangxiensis]|uniref:Esterase/lipase family protein n=1 Tax=Nocardia jiangxiensis TaxID=282685 RepID=A0ABW6S639_9NOCA|nr:alpha/beta fold hydrolase [Nocardia jiangxiensis]